MENILNLAAFGSGASAAQVLLNIILTFILSWSIAIVYKYTHSGLSYSRSFVFTLILMSIVISVIMMVIGNNLVRAFGSLGALALIRFRTVVKETRDTSFIFLALAIGMAVGTSSYAIAILTTILVSLIIIVLHKINFGSIRKHEYILSFEFDNEKSTQDLLVNVFKKHFKNTILLNIHSKQDGRTSEMIYHVNFIDDTKQSDLVRDLSTVDGVENVHLITSTNDIEY